jgi:hypothetical protein
MVRAIIASMAPAATPSMTANSPITAAGGYKKGTVLQRVDSSLPGVEVVTR